MAERKAWPEVWLTMAHTIAARSVDPRLQVGCVIVSNDNRRILGLGYNGDERGGANEPDGDEPGESGFVHAEINAIINAQQSLYGSHVYVTHTPCVVCARALVNAGVWMVTYAESYRKTEGLRVLERAKVGTCQRDHQ